MGSLRPRGLCDATLLETSALFLPPLHYRHLAPFTTCTALKQPRRRDVGRDECVAHQSMTEIKSHLILRDLCCCIHGLLLEIVTLALYQVWSRLAVFHMCLLRCMEKHRLREYSMMFWVFFLTAFWEFPRLLIHNTEEERLSWWWVQCISPLFKINLKKVLVVQSNSPELRELMVSINIPTYSFTVIPNTERKSRHSSLWTQTGTHSNTHVLRLVTVKPAEVFQLLGCIQWLQPVAKRHGKSAPTLPKDYNYHLSATFFWINFAFMCKYVLSVARQQYLHHVFFM